MDPTYNALVEALRGLLADYDELLKEYNDDRLNEGWCKIDEDKSAALARTLLRSQPLDIAKL